eukprot:TRINITY_DN60626_c0_g1_i1.p1 TRINITY_DN60626_c0_g1~~TRINITY_DN60626_c0_g1_i1.p1  ORF type:complete len:526 (-),score=85.45 TRINITY_DN60626_c0_g1_i1:116-1555(-)
MARKPPTAGASVDATCSHLHAAPATEEILEQVLALAKHDCPWDASEWLRLREKAWAADLHSVLPALLDSAQKTSQQAMQDEYYRLSQHRKVDLNSFRHASPSYRWLCKKTRLFRSMPVMASAQSPQGPPPLIFSPLEELELGCKLVGKLAGSSVGPAASRPIVVVSSEVSQFCSDSFRLDGHRQGSRSPEASLLIRTDLEHFLARAAKGLASTAPVELLTASSDPYVLICRDVAVFRGPSQDGFPFFSKPLNFDVVLRAQEVQTKTTSTAGSLELCSEGSISLLERLKLVALAALDRAREDAASASATEMQAPHVVLGIRLQDYPLELLAKALQEWHRIFVGQFASMVVAAGCSGSRDVAQLRVLEELASFGNRPSQSLDVLARDLHDPGSQCPRDGDTSPISSCSSLGAAEVCRGLKAVALAMAESQQGKETRPISTPVVRRKSSPIICALPTPVRGRQKALTQGWPRRSTSLISARR